ncbi:MAG TPA: hypothetical protein VEI99_04040 [Terriglobales bacterium]|nr:hypothetical protein [Terriglobales bacterium]
MSSIGISLTAFAFVFGGALVGMLFRSLLPPQHLGSDSKDTVKSAMGLVSTMSALVLGLLVSSAKSFYDTQSAELNQMSGDVVSLDRVLAHYGPEAKEGREALRGSVVRQLEQIWPQKNTQSVAPGTSETLIDKIQGLSPKDDKQRSLQAQAMSMAISLGRMRWLMYEQGNASVSKPMLTIMVFWLAVVFLSFGLFAPHNTTTIASLFAAGLSVSGAIFLILEMYAPFAGLIQISSAPLRSALEHLGQ